ncbi:MAG TPA: hypothetical protein V6D46_05480, partial [Coleofasciculaceae cyanobacterium]
MPPEVPPELSPKSAPTRSPDRLQLATQWIVLGLIVLAWVGPAFSPEAPDSEPPAQSAPQQER